MQPFRVGYQIFSWRRHYPGSWWLAARQLAGLGYRGIEGEYTIAELYEGRESEFRDQMQRYGMDLAAFYSTTDLDHATEGYENRRKNLAAARFAKPLGCKVIVIGGTEATERTADRFQEYARQANALGKEVFEATGLKIGVHPHLGSLIEKRPDIDRIMEMTDPRYYYLCPDTAHLAAGGSDPVEVFRTYRSRIIHTHFKDYRPPAKPGEWGQFLELGQGTVDFPALVTELKGAGYRGWIDVELDGSPDPERAAGRNREYLVKTLHLDLEAGAGSPPPKPACSWTELIADSTRQGQ
ncbi:MAG TPA: sugar phosphate isomerase/epimerase [Terriglobia bacterium]|nr:sugar phosphate isomerase/epimerase [Terriglobia bacterium]